MAMKSGKLYELKKTVRDLSSLSGTGTQLISVYIPAGYPIHETAGKLREEVSQATNIKSKQTRTNVIDALEKILHYMKMFKQTPESGLVIFAGNVSGDPSKRDIQLFSLEPPMKLNVSIYRCDSRFFLEPLERMLDTREAFGIIVLDGREATLAIVKGTETQIVKKIESMAHAKVRKGGQCLAPDSLVEMADGTIKQIKELKKNECIRSMGMENRKIGNRACSDVFVTKARVYYAIRTKCPKNEIEATLYHRFLVLSEYGIKEKYAKDLKIGDRLLSVREINHNGSDLETGVSCKRRIVLPPEERARLRKRRLELGYSQKYAGKKIGITQMSICRMEDGKIPLSDARIRALYKVYGLRLDEKKFSKKKFHFPKYYTPDLAYLMGIICGDGTKGENRIAIYESKEELVKRYCKIIKKVLKVKPIVKTVNKVGKKGSWAKKPYYEIRIYSLDFCNAILKIAPEVVATGKERGMPPAISKCRKEVIAGFLRGLFDAEGYIHGKRVDLAMINKSLVKKIQLLLLRFGIIASFGEKNVKGNPQWYVSISDISSLKNFERYIGFSRSDKAHVLKKNCKRKVKSEYINQIALDGREAYSLIRRIGMKTSDFHAASCFFRNVKPLGKEAFARNIVAVVKKKAKTDKEVEVLRYFETLLKSDIVPASVAGKELKKAKKPFYDVTIPVNSNFVANGLVVHNSARRYERLIEESIERYYKRVGEAVDKHFLNRVQGVIIGGPGPTKDFFEKAKAFNYQIKVLGVVDTGYTDEYGVREVLAKSESILSEQESVKERVLVDRFIKEVVKDGLATYGLKEVTGALESKQADIVLISEELGFSLSDFECEKCGERKRKITKEEVSELECPSCGAGMMLLEELPLIDYLIDKGEELGVKVEVISTNTAEGMQFLQGFGGLGAFLKYKKRY